MGMVQRGNRPALAFHALFQFRRRRKMRGENLHGYGAIKAGVKSTVNFSHAACTQRSLDFVGGEVRASGEGHPGRAIIARTSLTHHWDGKSGHRPSPRTGTSGSGG